jgi:hypothetical protein
MNRLPTKNLNNDITDSRLIQIRDELRAIRIGVWILVLIVLVFIFISLLGSLRTPLPHHPL